MTNLLAVVPMPERFCRQFNDHLTKTFPELSIHVVDHPSKTGPYIESADILMAHHLPDEVIAKAKSLKWAQTLGTGTDGFLSRPSFPKDVLLTRMHDVQGAPASEAVLGLMLALSRQLPRLIHNQRRRVWDRGTARLLDKKTVGILGVGRIGEALAPKCQALGMTVVGISSGRTDVRGFHSIRPRSELTKIVGTFDYLIILIPFSPETKHIVERSVLRAMKPSAYLINIARGGVLDEEALLEALRENWIAGAALDVFANEPLPEANPLWEQENLIITPHAAAMHEGYVDFMLPTLVNNIRNYLDGKRGAMLNVVDH